MIEIEQIKPNKVSRLLLAKVVARNPRFATVQGIMSRVETGQSKLISIKENGIQVGALILDVIECDTGAKIMNAPHLAGMGLETWYEPLAAFMFKSAAEAGCETLLVSGRKGWERISKRHNGKFVQSTYEYSVADNV